LQISLSSFTHNNIYCEATTVTWKIIVDFNVLLLGVIQTSPWIGFFTASHIKSIQCKIALRNPFSQINKR
jgi:hypothetical protein